MRNFLPFFVGNLILRLALFPSQPPGLCVLSVIHKRRALSQIENAAQAVPLEQCHINNRGRKNKMSKKIEKTEISFPLFGEAGLKFISVQKLVLLDLLGLDSRPDHGSCKRNPLKPSPPSSFVKMFTQCKILVRDTTICDIDLHGTNFTAITSIIKIIGSICIYEAIELSGLELRPFAQPCQGAECLREQLFC